MTTPSIPNLGSGTTSECWDICPTAPPAGADRLFVQVSEDNINWTNAGTITADSGLYIPRPEGQPYFVRLLAVSDDAAGPSISNLSA
jgi:hypothetical protein